MDPLKLLITNTPGDVAYPLKFLGGDGLLSVNAQAWPSRQDLGQPAANYHASLAATQREFDAIPVDLRGAVDTARQVA